MHGGIGGRGNSQRLTRRRPPSGHAGGGCKSVYFPDGEFRAYRLGDLGPVPNPSIIVAGRVVERGYPCGGLEAVR